MNWFDLIFWTLPSWYVFWKLYQKAGEPGWTAIAPFYQELVLGKIVERKVVGIIAGLAGLSLWVSNVINIAHVLGSSYSLHSPSSQSFVHVLAVLLIVFLVFYLYLLNRFMKRFDRGIGFWAVMILLPLIGVFIVNKANFKGDNVPPTTTGQSQPPAVVSNTSAINVPPTNNVTAVNPPSAVQPRQPLANNYPPDSNVRPPTNPTVG